MTLSKCFLDPAALASIGEERLDWRFKAIPPSLWGLTVNEAATRRPNLFGDGFTGPIVVLEADALDHNLRTMSAWCTAHGVRLAPHGKTTMAPQLFARQIEHGAWGITCANAAQLRVYRAFGVSRILFANQLVDPAALRWLSTELAADPRFEFSCWVDSVRAVELMTRALLDAPRPVDVLIELGGDGGRTGVRDEATARAVAAAIRDSPVLRLAGVGGYEGALAHDAGQSSFDTVAFYARRLRELAIGLSDSFETGEVIVTAGGSAFFDHIAEELTTGWPTEFPVVPVLRSGAYLTHDDGYYRRVSPLGEHPRVESTSSFRSALRAWAQVTSKPTTDLALLTLGKRDASFDDGLPEPQWYRRDGRTLKLAGHTVTKLNDQHAFVALPGDSPLEVGDWVGLGLSHPCTVFDKWSLIPLVDGEIVTGFVRTYF
ncbi:amino acid deaminase [Amycolatopsis taiwanensis]|uniref:Amino acid deaminase n=1 Tax=Amycolatopsis taiwanensis TaxID=342230 RepID=A0A9W6R593_9PSEU|nr:amino acid deaminase [Amycolatopsis taiwanensis]GLY69498.1 amino acid deaminase [Amycolatopsis taiwanensis]